MVQKRAPTIDDLIREGQYLIIRAPMQCVEAALSKSLGAACLILSVDLHSMPADSLQEETAFVQAISRLILQGTDVPEDIAGQLRGCIERQSDLMEMFQVLRRWCAISPMPIVLILGGVDAEVVYQPFRDLLAMSRMGHIQRDADGAPTFLSVILAGTLDIVDLGRIARQRDLRYIPWNIAVPFDMI